MQGLTKHNGADSVSDMPSVTGDTYEIPGVSLTGIPGTWIYDVWVIMSGAKNYDIQCRNRHNKHVASGK